MMTRFHNMYLGSSQSKPGAAATTHPSLPTPVGAIAERTWCAKCVRVKAGLTAVVVCALTVLFIQQTVYTMQWKPALPLGLGSQDHVTSEFSNQLPEEQQEKKYPGSESRDVANEKQKTPPLSLERKTLIENEDSGTTKKDTTMESYSEKQDKHNFKLTLMSDIEDEEEQPSNSEEAFSLSHDGPKTDFSSPLVVSEGDWPLRQSLVPITIKTALGQASSEETSATRPITVAYIRNCKTGNPRCIEEHRLNFAKRCPYPGLVQTEDWDSADIVVMNVWRMRGERYVPSIQRPPGQVWVMLSTEAPSRKANHSQLDFQGLKGQFNLTMSYRLDSDIPYLYGHLQRATVSKERDFEAVYSAKRFHAAWLVSHCQTKSKREKYVKLLQAAGLEVHIYGLCGNYSCQDGHTSTSENANLPDRVCMPHISKNYYFYLSFENTLCKDYITEKVFKIFDPVDLIPVVMGGADYNKYLPPGTFVNVADYDTARGLARHLIRLASNKTRYLDMLHKKHQWKRVARQPWFCTFGEKLATGLRPKLLQDTRSWYVRDQCWLPYHYIR